jgi:hypothetical protein
MWHLSIAWIEASETAQITGTEKARIYREKKGITERLDGLKHKIALAE